MTRARGTRPVLVGRRRGPRSRGGASRRSDAWRRRRSDGPDHQRRGADGIGAALGDTCLRPGRTTWRTRARPPRPRRRSCNAPIRPTRSRSRRWSARTGCVRRRRRAGRSTADRGEGRVGQRRPEPGALSVRTSCGRPASTCPNAYVAGGTDDLDRAGADSARRASAGVHHAAGGGVLAHEERPDQGQSNWKYLGGPLGINAAGAVDDRPERPERQHGLRRHRRGEHLRLRLRGRHRHLQVDQRRLHLDRPDRRGRVRRARASARSWSSPATPSTIYAATTTALRGMSLVVLLGRHPTGARRGTSGASTSRRTAAPPGRFIHNGSSTRPTAPATSTEFNNAGTCSPRGVRDVALDPTEPEHRLRVLVRARRLALERCRRDVDPDQAVAERGGDPDPAGDRGQRRCRTARPGCTSTRATPGATALAALPQRRRGHRRAGVHRPDQHQHRRPGLGVVQPVRPASAGTTCSSTRPKGYPDMVYAGGSYSYGETIANKRGVVLSTDAGVSGTDMTMDGTDPSTRTGCTPTSTRW